MNAKSYTALMFVIGASVGALIGLAFIKSNPWWILVGAVVGVFIVGLIGLRVGVAGTPLAGAIDDSALEAGCCLMELLGAGCLGCGTLTAVFLSGLLFVALHLAPRPLVALRNRMARVGVGYSASRPLEPNAGRGRRPQSLRVS